MDEREVYVNWSAKDLAGFWTGRALDLPNAEPREAQDELVPNDLEAEV